MNPSTKEQIIQNAKELFTTYNYDSVSMSDIAKKMGISKAALYHHFTNKEKIYLEAVKSVHEHFMGQFKKIIQTNISSKEKLKKILSSFLELKMCKNNKSECHNIIIMQKLSKHDKDATMFIKKSKDKLYKILSPLFDEIISQNNNLKNIKKEFLFLLIFGAINSYALNRTMLGEESLNKDEIINNIIKLIFKN